MCILTVFSLEAVLAEQPANKKACVFGNIGWQVLGQTGRDAIGRDLVADGVLGALHKIGVVVDDCQSSLRRSAGSECAWDHDEHKAQPE